MNTKYAQKFNKKEKALNDVCQTYPVRDKMSVEREYLTHTLVPSGTKCDKRSIYFVPNGTINRIETLFSTNILSLTGQRFGLDACFYRYIVSNGTKRADYPVRDKMSVEREHPVHTLVPLGTICDTMSIYFVPNGTISRIEQCFSTNIVSLTGQRFGLDACFSTNILSLTGQTS
jgi:hypothetical protein